MMKKLLLGCLAAWVLGACTPAKQQEAIDEIYLLVGSYCTPQKEGIKVYLWDNENGEATYVSGLSGLSNPSYQVISANGNRVYSVGEDEGLTSTAHALTFDKESGKLALMNTLLTNGGAPCYINLSPDEQYVVTANYMGGSLTVFPLEESGRLAENSRTFTFEGTGPDKTRQEQSHLHCANFTPDGKFLLANDLGTDQIHVFPLAEDGQLDDGRAFDVALEPGSGPRHLCFSEDGKFVYLLNELSGKVTAFMYEGNGLTSMQYIVADSVGGRGSADIHLSPDGKFLYASNRLKADGIAIFKVDDETGRLTKVGYQLTGIHPRNFTMTHDGRFLLVACRESNVIQIYGRDADTGLLKDTGKKIETSEPVCLTFVE